MKIPDLLQEIGEHFFSEALQRFNRGKAFSSDIEARTSD